MRTRLKPHSWLLLGGILLTGIIAGAICAWFIPRDWLCSEYYARARRASELRYCAEGLYEYADLFDALPSPTGGPFPEGSVRMSWRAVLCPFQTSGWPELDLKLPWDHPTNIKRAAHYYRRNGTMWVYSFRRDARHAATVFGDTTNILAVIGADTAFGDGHRTKWRSLPQDLIILVDAKDTGIPWWAPGDLDVDSGRFAEVPESYNLGVDGRGLHVAFADMEVWYLENSVPWEELAKFFTVTGAEKYDRAEALEPYLLERLPGESLEHIFPPATSAKE